MSEILSRCGYRCDLCLAYRQNVNRQDEREYLRDNWKTYFGLEIPVERLICDGCLGCEKQATRLDAACPVRPCVIERALEHCGQCESFSCEKLELRRGHSLERAREAAGPRFSMSTYRRCVLPYDNFARLAELRKDVRRLERLTNPAIVPDLGAMGRFIGEPVAHLFAELVRFLHAQAGLAVDINYAGRNYGWEVRARKGSRPIISVTPLRRAFQVLCVMGKNELEAHEADRGLFSGRANRLIEETKKLHDGKWVYLRAADEADLRDALALFAVKRFGRKARESVAGRQWA
ncbi:MAG: DUF3788 family protein [Bacillota bacterium]|nr:DUF3788 family protein [Bacillota bacterium]